VTRIPQKENFVTTEILLFDFELFIGARRQLVSEIDILLFDFELFIGARRQLVSEIDHSIAPLIFLQKSFFTQFCVFLALKSIVCSLLLDFPNPLMLK
jgi:hypothetical protein